jgi:hypothetical protein
LPRWWTASAVDQRRALRADHQGKGDPSEPDLRLQQDPRDGTRAQDDLTRPSIRPSTDLRDRGRQGARRFRTLRELAQGSLETIELCARAVTGVPTGFNLDEMTSGLQPSDPIIIAAPSMGASLALNSRSTSA